MTANKFGLYLNIDIYRARSQQDCQFGTLPNEGIMNTIQHFNANVFTSTAMRARLTLGVFTFSKAEPALAA
eukprot:2299108-Karenia_brevis.AAC.1